jgi:myo-inositol 2-dehydrogenase/D-chiro-inositol 1-dehydrogenase
MKKIRIGIIGAGEIATTHAAILQQQEEVILGSFYDVERGERTRQFAARFGMEPLDDAAAVIADSDAVYVTAPNRFHADLTLQVLEQGRHVFCEKPFALNLADARKIVAAAETADVVYQLGFNRRLAPAYRKMKDLITTGELSPQSFNIKMNRGELQVPPWTSNPDVTGGFLFESTLHLIDMVRYLFGEVREITAVGSRALYPSVDNFSMIFRMENGIHGVFSSCAHATWVFPFERVEIYGDHASIFNDEMEAVTYSRALNSPVEKLTFPTLPVEERWGYVQEDRAFINRIVGRESDDNSLVATAIDGLKNVELVEAIYDQIGLGR